MNQMTKKAAFLGAALVLARLLTGCAASGPAAGAPQASNAQPAVSGSADAGSAAGSAVQSTAGWVALEYSAEDMEETYDIQKAVKITLNGDSAAVEGAGAGVSGSVVTISTGGTFLLSGRLDDGQIIIDAPKTDTVRLILNDVQVHCSDSAPLYAKQAKKTILTLADGTVNRFTDGENYQYPDAQTDEPDAAVFCKDDLTINGSGSLEVTGSFNNGIGTKDQLVITNGSITVDAANDALRGRDSVAIRGGTFTLSAQGDGIKSNNDEDAAKGFISLDGGVFTIRAGNDGVQAETSLQISAGAFDILTGGGSAAGAKQAGGGFPAGRGGGSGRTVPAAPASGSPGTAPDGMTAADAPVPPEGNGRTAAPAAADTALQEQTESMKALKAGTALLVGGGSFQIDAQDDALHSNGSVTLEGGEFQIATGDDGVHADAALLINDGTLEITQCYEGLEGASVTMNGGTVRLTASDDGVNAAGGSDGRQPGRPQQDAFQQGGEYFIRVTGGYLAVDAQGDGLDSNGNLYLEGGTVLVNGPTGSGDGALDYDGDCQITGGILIAAGSAGMMQTAGDSSTQNTLAVVFTGEQEAGTLVALSDADGTPILSYAPNKKFQAIQFSSPALEEGKTYLLSTGGSCAQEGSDGYYGDAACTGGAKRTEAVLSGTVTTVSEDGAAISLRGGMGGARPGGMGGRRGGEKPGGTASADGDGSGSDNPQGQPASSPPAGEENGPS